MPLPWRQSQQIGEYKEVKTATMLYSVAAVLLCGTLPAMGQRVRFATPVSNTTAQYSSNAYGAGSAPAYSAPPSTSTYDTSPAPTYGSASPAAAPGASSPPALLSSPPSTYAQPGAAAGGIAPPYAPQPGDITTPSVVPGGAIQPPPGTWDPYATPNGTPSALLQNDPYFQSSPNLSMATMQKFIQHIDLDYDWFAGHGDHELGINDMGISVTCAFPIFYNSQTPLLVTPGFFLHCWDGPVSYPQTSPAEPWPADLPPRTYDAYLDAAWNPQVNQWFGGELNFRIGAYSDFKRVTSSSLRYMGKAWPCCGFRPT